MNEQGLDVGVSIFAETDFVVGNQPQLTAQPLPPLEIDDDLPDGKIELALPIYADWKTLNGLIETGLEQPVFHEGDDYRLEVAAAGLSYDPEGSVVASIETKVEPKGWIGWMLYYLHRVPRALGLDIGYLRIYEDHQIALSVRPVVSEDGRRILSKDARLMPQSRPLMETLAADYYELTEESPCGSTSKSMWFSTLTSGWSKRRECPGRKSANLRESSVTGALTSTWRYGP